MCSKILNSLRQLNLVKSLLAGITIGITIGIAISASPTQSLAAQFDHWIEKESSKLRLELSSLPEMKPFQSLPEPLFQFLITEKLHLYLESTPRYYVDDQGKPKQGYEQSYTFSWDDYHPGNFKPFMIKGIWIPVSEGEAQFNSHTPIPLPIFRTNNVGEREILFLIHPKSENLYSSLLAKYSNDLIEVPALSLSSFRTLLVAIRSGHSSLGSMSSMSSQGSQGSMVAGNKWTYLMAKVSLDEKINKINRTLSRKETIGSMAMSYVMKKKAAFLPIMEDVFSFVPNSHYLPRGHEFETRGAGMLIRSIPDFLFDPKSNFRLVPLFAILGTKNQCLLDEMIHSSGVTPTEFITDRILRPYARVYLNLIFRKEISIEVHGQNMLLLLDANTSLPVKDHEFIYRDMGGINLLLNSIEMSDLPQGLGKDEFFYFKNFIIDASTSIEDHFVNQVLYPLTKQFVQNSVQGNSYSSVDPEFVKWKNQMSAEGKLNNWLGTENLTQTEFQQYGYFEQKFGQILVEELNNLGILRAIDDKETAHMEIKTFIQGLNEPLPTQSFNKFLRYLMTSVSHDDL